MRLAFTLNPNTPLPAHTRTHLSIIGTPFYLMHYVPGRVLKDPALPGMGPRERGQVYREMARVLAAIHTVDVERTGLTDFGKHGA